MIVISKKEAAGSSITQQKQIIVKGIVKDENGEPVVGANVVEKGTSNGTIWTRMLRLVKVRQH